VREFKSPDLYLTMNLIMLQEQYIPRFNMIEKIWLAWFRLRILDL
jgi:hypothetical protein